jgi:hypothetical protein
MLFLFHGPTLFARATAAGLIVLDRIPISIIAGTADLFQLKSGRTSAGIISTPLCSYGRRFGHGLG